MVEAAILLHKMESQRNIKFTQLFIGSGLNKKKDQSFQYQAHFSANSNQSHMSS